MDGNQPSVKQQQPQIQPQNEYQQTSQQNIHLQQHQNYQPSSNENPSRIAATPRMLRSLSGVKSKSELNQYDQSQPSESNNNNNSINSGIRKPSDSQLLPPLSIPSPASTPLGVSSQDSTDYKTNTHNNYDTRQLPKVSDYSPGSSRTIKNVQNQQFIQQQSYSNHTSQNDQFTHLQRQQHQQSQQQPQALSNSQSRQQPNWSAQPQTASSQPHNQHQHQHHHQHQHSQPQQQAYQPPPPQAQPQPQPQQQQPHQQQPQRSQQPQQSQQSQQTQQPQQQQQFHRKSIGDWDFVKTIGAGSMGKVKLAQHNSTKEICAVKIIPRAAKLYQRAHANDPPPQTSQEASQRHKEFEKELARDKRTIREGALGRLLFHPFICRLYEMVPMTNHYYMLFEYIEGGQMLDYIVAHGSLKERHARKFARGIASALDYCHRNNVVHRDLKIENIMINEKGDVKIIDFGLSNLYSPKSLLKTYCGSLYFAAPELLSAKPYLGPEVDIWSFGVVLYVLVCGKVPFDDQSVSVLHEKIKKGNVEYPNFLSRECISLLSRMLVVDPTKRASLYEILTHPWLNKGYDHRISNYLPKREPLHLPLDPEIIRQISTFDLGSVQTITDELTNLLTSVEYQMCCENWYNMARQGKEYASAPNAHLLPDPTGGFHPLISIYFLVLEMRKRKKAKEDAIRAQAAQQEQLKQQQLQQQAQAMLPSPREDTTSLEQDLTKQPLSSTQPFQPQLPLQSQPQSQTQQTPVQPNSGTATQVEILGQYSSKDATTPQPRIIETFAESPSKTLDPKQTPVLSIPEQAHTTMNSPSIKNNSNNNVDPLAIPEQQPKSPRSTTPDTLDPNRNSQQPVGFNNILRKLSTKKSKGTSSPKGSDRDSSSIKISPQSSTHSKIDPMVRRGISMKVTAKEKESSSRLSPTKDIIKKEKKSSLSHSRTPSSSKPHGFIPVEYLPPLPNYDPSTNTLIQDSNPAGPPPQRQQTLTVPSRKLHPTARAKSVGGQIRKDAYGRARSASTNRNDTSNSPQGSGSIGDQNDGTLVFFDDVKLDDMDVQEVPQLSEDEIMRQYHEAKPGTMPSIEHCKTLFLKGFFSVQTTSTKPLPVIRYNIINVLSKLGVRFHEVKGGFICIHTPSVQQASPNHPDAEIEELEDHDDEGDEEDEDEDDEADQILNAYANEDEENQLYGDAFKSKSSTLKSLSFEDKPESIPDGAKTPSRQPSLHIQTQTTNHGLSGGPLSPTKYHRSSNSIGGGHRRKVSFGNAILGSYRKKNGSQVMMPPNTPATVKTVKGIYDEDYLPNEQNNHNNNNNNNGNGIDDAFEIDNSAESFNNYGGGSDMLISSKIEHKIHHNRSTSTSSNSNKNHPSSKSPLKFEIHIVKVPLLGFYGVQFKKLSGNTWNYKTLAGQILNEMNL
ncbi:KIN2 [Candida pseudojiufengensis]|uniref:KIN2 n=1 Tax=Candida pseudojiufengensis TaxID=497109 RepID=UPI0022245C80|nr:KIN2 [Candida pseudojiufengensis]KAI5963466.1 KIN2 [Candida pseudojiufengensis]